MTEYKEELDLHYAQTVLSVISSLCVLVVYIHRRETVKSSSLQTSGTHDPEGPTPVYNVTSLKSQNACLIRER